MAELLAQGATEYLVLLAVVLIVALVSVALLGFFPRMASDSQSEMYWKSASPIAITEWAAKTAPDGSTYVYFRMRNTGAYSIRLAGIVDPIGEKMTRFGAWGCGLSGQTNISDYYYLAPGEEDYVGWATGFGLACDREVMARIGATSGYALGGASSVCQNSTSSPGTLIWQSLGFEYIAYIEGQQITKRQIGKQVFIKCMPPQ